MKHRLLLLAAPLLCASCASRPAEGPPPADAGVRAAARMPTPPPPAEWFAENERALDLGGGVRMRMLPVPAGVFRMGSPRSEYGRPLGTAEDPVLVTLTRPCWLAETETTQAAWAAVMDGETPVDLARRFLEEDLAIDGRRIRDVFGFPKDGDPAAIAGPCEPDHPVVWVSWTDAAEFCRRVDARERAAGRVPDGYEYRLPTEAEWERACRAGETAALPNGRSLRYIVQVVQPELDDIAWYWGNCTTNPPAGGGPLRRNWGPAVHTHAVGTKAPNDWGFRDMIGNVFEWCADAADGTAQRPFEATDPVGLAPAGIRANRGGSWAVPPQPFLRSAARSFCVEGWRVNDLGFRLALAPKLPPAAAANPAPSINP